MCRSTHCLFVFLFCFFFCSVHIETDSTAIFCYLFLRYHAQVGSLSISDIKKKTKKTLKQNRNKGSKQKEPLVFC